jgi:5S rRNA maturation endonuclease (ribonuclease M5)
MSKTILLLVEGKSDLFFLRDLIKTNYNCPEPKNKMEKKIISETLIEFENFNLLIKVCQLNEKINSVGGWSNLKNLATVIEEQNYSKILIIFDSDFSGNNIEYKEREIKKWVNDKFEYSTFYLPYNDKNKGEDLEELIEYCINKDYSNFLPCWKSFESCLTQNIKADINYPDRKRKIFAFKDSLLNVDQNIHESYLCKAIWNIDYKTNDNLALLKEFLDNNIIITNE